MKKNMFVAGISAALALSTFQVQAGVPKDLPYPSGDLTAEQVADQVYFVNHFYALKNYGIAMLGKRPKPGKITVLINKAKGRKPTTVTLERYLNNDYTDGVVQAKDIAIFRTGKLKGTGMLIVDYVDDAKPQSYSIWLPALRKIRRFAQPAHDDAWGGTDWTFGDVTLRKPLHETHELLGKETFNDCLNIIDDEKLKTKWLKNAPEKDCSFKGREVYKLKSTTKFENWWYDYRISYVDTKSFADYRTDYFKDGEKIKIIDRSWGKFKDIDDPRALYWKYWYGQTYATGHETWVVIPEEVTVRNEDRPDDFWTEKTLRKIKR